MSVDVDQSGGMNIDEMGPVDYLVVEFPGNKMTGEGLPLLVDLVDRGIIRILDFAFVMKELDGSVHAIEIADFDGDGQLDLAVFEGASSGLLDEGDLDEAGGVLEPGCSAGVLVYENVWAAPLAVALRRGGAQMVASGRIPVQALLAAAEALDAADAADAASEVPRSERRERGRSNARTYPRGGPDGRHRWYGDRGVQPGLAASGRPVGGAGPAAAVPGAGLSGAAACAGSGGSGGSGRVGHGRQAGPAEGSW